MLDSQFTIKQPHSSLALHKLSWIHRVLLTLCIVHCTSCISFAQFSATTSQSTVAVGDQFQITYAFQGNGTNFRAPAIPDFNTLMGPSQSTSMQIMNGSVSQSISFTYVLQAVKEGTFTISPATIESSGKNGKEKFMSNSLNIIVVKGNAPAAGGQKGGGNQQQSGGESVAGGKNVFLKVSVDKANAYQGEGIIVTYKLFTKVDLVNYAISKMPSSNGFWSQEIQLPQQPQFHYENYDGVQYKVAEIKKFVLFPQRSGSLSLEPMEGEVIARVQVKRQQSRDPFDQFFNNPFFGNVQDVKVALKSETVRITVHDLPTHAPANFTGAVGNFSMEASLDKNETKAHDAVTLKIKVTGKGNVKLIETPKINFPAEFESYDPKVNTNVSATVAGVSGSKTFEYLIIPRNAGEYKIPISGFSYFDLDKKRYVSIDGTEFLLKVAKGAETVTTTVSGVSKSDIQFIGKDIRFIKTAVPSFVQSNQILYNTPVFYSLIAAPALMFVFLLVFRRRYQEMQSNITLMRSRKANKVAKKRLSAAKKFLGENKREAFLDEMFRALWGFISDKLQISVSELTKDNVVSALSAKNISKESTELFIEALDACELARFAPGVASSIDEIYKKGIAVISKLEEEIT